MPRLYIGDTLSRMSDAPRDARAKARATWPLTHHRLDESSSDLVADTTPSQRVAMVWALTLDAWASSGRPLPDYRRSESPGQIRRGNR